MNHEISAPQIRAQAAPWRQGVELYIGNRDLRVSQILIEKVEPDSCYEVAPSFSIDSTAAQVLMDDLWNCGIRPTEGAGTAGAMRATERHLEDMRTLVFNTKPKTKK